MPIVEEIPGSLVTLPSEGLREFSSSELFVQERASPSVPVSRNDLSLSGLSTVVKPSPESPHRAKPVLDPCSEPQQL